MHPAQYQARTEASRILSEKEAAKKTRLSVSLLRRLRYVGGGPVYLQLSRRRIGYREADIDTWLDERRVPSGQGGA